VLGEDAVVVAVPSLQVPSLVFFRNLDIFEMTVDLAIPQSFASASLSIYDTLYNVCDKTDLAVEKMQEPFPGPISFFR
jgi:hypothetical protein